MKCTEPILYLRRPDFTVHSNMLKSDMKGSNTILKDNLEVQLSSAGTFAGDKRYILNNMRTLLKVRLLW